MLRKDEKFCIEAVASWTCREWIEGEDPPDAYLKMAEDKIAVEISTLTQYVNGPNGCSEPRLSDDVSACSLCDDLNQQLEKNIPDNKKVILYLLSPIKKKRKLMPKLREEILSLLQEMSSDNVAVERMILGNKIGIKIPSERRPNGKRVLGIIQNEKSSADILANAKAILSERIRVKSEKCRLLESENPIWLALINDYFIAGIDIYKQAMDSIPAEHPFERVLLVSDNGSINVLYQKQSTGCCPNDINEGNRVITGKMRTL